MKRKLRNFEKSRYINAEWPTFAHTSAKTTGVTPLVTPTLTNGFEPLGVLQPTAYQDPFGTVATVGIDGVIDTDSLIEATGHDLLAVVYTSYRVYSSTFVIKIHQLPHVPVFTQSATDFTGSAQTPTYTMTSNMNEYHTLVAIPSVTSTAVAVTWHEAMQHPLAIKKTIRPAKGRSAGPSTTMKLKLDHTWFIKKMLRHSTQDVGGNELAWISMISDPGTGQNIFWHLYICSFSNSASSADHGFGISYTSYQQIMLSKFDGSDNSIVEEVAEDYDVTVTG